MATLCQAGLPGVRRGGLRPYKSPQWHEASSTRARIYELLEASGGGADVVAQVGDVGAVGADAAGVHGQAENFRLLDAQTSVVEFGEAVAFSGHAGGGGG